MKKVVLITGASSGFGRLTAEKLLATNEWVVYAASRKIEKMNDLKEKGAILLKMDVTSDDDVNIGVAQIISEQGKLDAFLGNAGYGSYGMLESVPMEEIKYQYEVNVFGNARVLKAVLPQMRKQKSGRIVFTTSLVSRISMLGLGWYSSTKHAVKAMAIALRQEVKDLGIQVVLIEPGVVKTEFDTIALDTLRKIDHPSEYKTLVDGFDQYMIDSYSNCPSPEGTAKCMFKAITAKKPKAVYKTTLDSKLLPLVNAHVSSSIFDKMMLTIIKKSAKKVKK